MVLYNLWKGVIQPGVIQPMERCYTTYGTVLYNLWNSVIQVIQPMEQCYIT